MLPWCLLYVIDKEFSDQQVPLLCKRYLAWSQCMKHTKNWDVKHGTQQQQEKKSNNNIKFFSFMKSNQIYNRSRRGTWRSLYAKKKKKIFLRFCSCCFKCFLFMHVTSKALTRLHLNPLSNFYDNSYTPPHTYIHRHAHKCNSHFFF